MPPQKRHSGARRSTKIPSKAPKKAASRRAKTQALAVTDAVKREPVVRRARLPNPLAVFEPLRRSVVDRQLELIGLAITWSPAHIVVDQHAAFWAGFAREAPRGGARRRPARKPKTRAKR